MDDALRKLADFERRWGGLCRWVASILFFLCVGALVHFGDAHYIKRQEFSQYRGDNATALREINGKLDSVIIGHPPALPPSVVCGETSASIAPV